MDYDDDFYGAEPVPDHRCEHGHRLWWNYGDGKPRHLTDRFGPIGTICTAVGDPEKGQA